MAIVFIILCLTEIKRASLEYIKLDADLTLIILAGDLGFHVSIAGGIANSVDNAKKIGCTAFQIFTRNPRGWSSKELGPDDVRSFRKRLHESNINPDSVAVHMPYLPNLSAPDGAGYEKSVETFCSELVRCAILQVPYLIIHLGSHLGKGSANGISQLVKACNNSIEKSKSTTKSNKNVKNVKILLENSAGRSNSVGATFKELGHIIEMLDAKQRFGVCFDTCHSFAAGYDLRNKAEVDKTIEDFDDKVGLKYLNLIHLNDSNNDIGSGLDRHEHVGLGKIGKEGFRAILLHNAIRKLPIIMETPIDGRRGNIENYHYVKHLLEM
jgi:deoxyribonuclease-4